TEPRTTLGRVSMRWRARLVALAVGGAALSTAALVHSAPLPALLVYLVLLATSLALWRLLVHREPAPIVLDLFVSPLVLRVLLVVLSHAVLVHLGLRGFAFADDQAYDKLGWDIARAWHGEIPGILQNDSYLLMNYTYLLGLLYLWLGHSLLAAKVVCAWFGA